MTMTADHSDALEVAAEHADDIGWPKVATRLREVRSAIERCPNCGHLRSTPMTERTDPIGKACELCRGTDRLKPEQRATVEACRDRDRRDEDTGAVLDRAALLAILDALAPPVKP